jgi:hypothetical protein
LTSNISGSFSKRWISMNTADMGRGSQLTTAKTTPTAAKKLKRTGGVSLRRHQQTAHFERELRYFLPRDFQAPTTLAGMQRIGEKAAVHRDGYFDLDNLLFLNRCSFRLRHKDTGEVEATFKRRPANDKQGAEAIRFELNHTGGEDFDPSNPAVAAALAITCGQRVERLFEVTTARRDHHYANDVGDRIALSEDQVTYPDGSQEARLEVEQIAGADDLLARCHQELTTKQPLAIVPRGKLSEARRRLPRN